MAKHANRSTSMSTKVTIGFLGGLTAAMMFAPVAGADNEYNVVRSTDRGVVNPGGTGKVTELDIRTGPQAARVTDSYKAELPEFTCPNVAAGTDALGSKGLGAGASMIFGGACG